MSNYFWVSRVGSDGSETKQKAMQEIHHIWQQPNHTIRQTGHRGAELQHIAKQPEGHLEHPQGWSILDRTDMNLFTRTDRHADEPIRRYVRSTLLANDGIQHVSSLLTRTQLLLQTRP